MKVKDGEEAGQATRQMIALGVDVIKVHDDITFSKLQAVAREAHRAGLNVIGHTGDMDAREAAAGGMDASAHLEGVLLALAPTALVEKFKQGQRQILESADFPLDAAKLEALAKFLVEKHFKLEPDLVNTGKGLYKQWLKFDDENYQLLKKTELSYIWPSAKDRWRYQVAANDFAQWAEPSDFTIKSPEEEARATAIRRKNYEYLELFVKKFVALGGEIIAGTDAQHRVVPGLSYHQEIQLLVENVGMTPMQALVSATRNPARFIHKDKDLGTLEVGKLADLLLVRGDPLQNIRNLRNIEMVIKDGKSMELGYHSWYRNPLPRPSYETGGVNPTPVIASLTPLIATEGDEEVTVTIKGDHFVPGCMVSFDGANVPLISGSRKELVIKVGRQDLVKVGTFPLVVTNPIPGGGSSQPALFMVKSR